MGPTLSWMNPTHILLPYISMTHFNIILSSISRFSIYISPSCFITKLCIHFSCYMPCPPNLPSFNHTSNIQLWIKMLSSSTCNILQPPITYFPLDQKILSALFSYSLNLHSSINAKNQVSWPYKTAGTKIIVLCTIFIHTHFLLRFAQNR